ncbi:hypothetical protein CEUSTIGMA_g11111.t1 [Chlamydomonas eustigma]|uniref:Uncharacterized protein n=1 Tax=Chlamydomonas eustigma TaxID=1157962 RepID=A0A250XKY5_9CHLO|nr:hypothetical protein CEUSTIGMA_g11111.t1 [Chlamydomonas eustigma]|eukprot:GAX83686.1 hypothetical protein CEUSTIGMA_g11111.t1 [Chlamydomonas eustigma]
MELFEQLGVNTEPGDGFLISYAVYPGISVQGLDDLRVQLLQDISGFSQDYIWNREPFHLETCHVQPPPWWNLRGRKTSKARRQDSLHETPCLWGQVNVGECVEDEWVIVALLFHISSIHQEISIQVWDDDGDFLLIEAAYALSKWLTPETSKNRVWIRAGKLHIIPPPSHLHPELPTFPTIPQALGILTSVLSPGGVTQCGRCASEGGSVSSSSKETSHNPATVAAAWTLASPKVQAALKARLGNLPGSALVGRVAVKAYLPLRVAAIIHNDPQYIAFGVEAFLNRNADDMRAAARMSYFPASEECVVSTVLMNPCQHAQMAQQKFVTPRGVNIDMDGTTRLSEECIDWGFKIRSGFEIVFNHAAKAGCMSNSSLFKRPSKNVELHPSPVSSSDAHKDHQPLSTSKAVGSGCSTSEASSCNDKSPSDLGRPASESLSEESSTQVTMSLQQLDLLPAWRSYLSHLKNRGYFEGQLEGSLRYKQLLEKAQDGFCSGPLLPKSMNVLSSPIHRAQRSLEAAVKEAGGHLTTAWIQAQLEAKMRVLEISAKTDDSIEETLNTELERRRLEMEESIGAKPVNRKSVPLAGKDNVEAKTIPPETRFEKDEVIEAADLVNRFTSFVTALSGHEGAELPVSERNVELDARRLLSELRRTLRLSDNDDLLARDMTQGVAEDDDGSLSDDEEGTSEGSSFYKGDEEDSSDDCSSDDSDHVQPGGSGQSKHVPPHQGFMRELERQMMAASSTVQPALGSMKGTTAAQRPVNFTMEDQQSTSVKTETDSDDFDEDNLSLGGATDDDQQESDDDDEAAGGVHATTGRQGAASGALRPQLDNRFFGQYDAVMSEQLRESYMAQSFEKQQVPPSSSAEGAGDFNTADHATGLIGMPNSTGRDGSSSTASSGILQPVDLDMNLVKSLLKSVAAQHGLSGPAGSLAGLLGIHLPQGLSEEAAENLP